MKAFIIVIILFTLLEFSCKKNPEKQSIYFTSKKIEINDKLKRILKQFIIENNCMDCINKLYIDKIAPYKTVITIEQIPFNSKDYKKLKPEPLLYILVDSCTFYVYNGMEGYFNVSYEDVDSTSKKIGDKYLRWSVVDTKDSIIINRNGSLPFFPFPSQ
jgi:hypothetical protein